MELLDLHQQIKQLDLQISQLSDLRDNLLRTVTNMIDATFPDRYGNQYAEGHLTAYASTHFNPHVHEWFIGVDVVNERGEYECPLDVDLYSDPDPDKALTEANTRLDKSLDLFIEYLTAGIPF